MTAPDPIVVNLIVFVLAIFVGYSVVWTVTPALHTPLMSVTNAISAIILVGAMLAAGPAVLRLGRVGWRDRRRDGRGQCVRRLPGHAADARDVQEKGAQGSPRTRKRPGTMGRPMSANQVALWYLVASICFIFALKGLSHPTTARRGNALGIIGMTLAVVVTLALIYSADEEHTDDPRRDRRRRRIGAVIARRVQMTQMPELVAAFHSLVGMAAVLIAIAAVHNPTALGLPNPHSPRATSSSFSSARSSARSRSRGR